MLRKIISLAVINNYDINQFNGYPLLRKHHTLIKTYYQYLNSLLNNSRLMLRHLKLRTQILTTLLSITHLSHNYHPWLTCTYRQQYLIRRTAHFCILTIKSLFLLRYYYLSS